jgi:4-hydroxybenzoate polyprenyltransferase
LASRWLRGARVIHPFPCLLNAVATAVFVGLAGGSASAATGLAAAMFCLQASIGAANDVVDAAADARAKPAKPIPAGLLTRRTATLVAVIAGGAGLALAGLFGAPALVAAVAGYALGIAYDVRLKRSRWSWLAYALALPLVPAFAWLGAGAGLPPRFPLLAVMALTAGTALALANGLVDLEGDAATGTRTLTGALGRGRSLRVIVACETVLLVVAAVTASPVPLTRAPLPWLALALGAAVMAAGVTLSAHAVAVRRRVGWEMQAASVGLLAVAWFALRPPA